MNAELILSIVLAVSTVLYTVINLLMLLESKATRRQKQTPILIAYIDWAESGHTHSICVKNIGEGCAIDVQFDVIKDYNQFGKQGLLLSKCLSFKNGMATFPPEQVIKYTIDWSSNINFSEKENYIELNIAYSDQRKKRYKNNIFKLPLNQIGGNTITPPESYLGQVAYYLKEIKELVNGVVKK